MKNIYHLSVDDNEAIFYHRKTFRELDRISFSILDNIFGKQELEHYLLTIRSFLYRMIEVNDSFYIIIKNSIINTAFPLLRHQFETFVQLKYIFFDKSKIKYKCDMYQYFQWRRQLKRMKCDENNEKKYLFYKPFKEIFGKYNNSKFDNWYSHIYEANISFKKLCNDIGEKERYDALYCGLSLESHGYAIMESNTKLINEKYYLKNFRTFDRHHTLVCINLDLMIEIFRIFTENYKLPKKLNDYTIDFMNRAKKYIENYYNISETFSIFYDYVI